MDISKIQQLVAEKIYLTKDATSTRGENTYSFVSFHGLKEALKDALPEGVSYSTQIGAHHPENGAAYNSLLGKVLVGDREVHSERVAMPLYQNPFDASGAITMLKKALIMSMFDLVPDEVEEEKLDLDETAMKALVTIATTESLGAALQKGHKHYKMTPTAIETLRKEVKKTKNGTTKNG